ncbi:WD40-repeat-containing domain protein [Sparassis latifolia]
MTSLLNSALQIWNGDVVKHALDDHTALVWALEVSTDGRWLMSASHDNTVRIWDTTSGSAVHCMEFPTELEFASISPDGRFIAVDGRLGKVEIWSLEKRTVIKRFKAHRSTVNDAVFTLHGEAVLTGSIDTDLKVWDMSTILTSAAPHSEINENTLESNQSTVLSISDNVPHTGVFVGHEYSAVSFDISHDGKWVVSGDQRGMVHIWDTKTTAVQCALRAHAVSAVRISPNNELIVTGDYNGRVRIFKFTAVDSCDEEALRVPAIPFEPPTSGNDRTDSVDATVLPIASSPTQMRVGPDNDHPLLAHDASDIPEQTDHSSPPATGPTHRSSVLVSSSTGVDSAQDARGTLIGSPRKSCGSKVFAKMRRVVDRLRRRVSLRKDER